MVSGHPHMEMQNANTAVQLWTQIVQGLESANYQTILPEYLRLSQMLSQVHITEVLTGKTESAQWAKLRKLSGRALEILGPLIEAARILHELPTDITQAANAPQPAPVAAPPEAASRAAAAPSVASAPDARTSEARRPQRVSTRKSAQKATKKKTASKPARKTAPAKAKKKSPPRKR